MKCWKCDKEMDGPEGSSIKGIVVEVSLEGERRTQETIDYHNRQLGKYSDGKGRCHVAICYECYVDGLFSIK